MRGGEREENRLPPSLAKVSIFLRNTKTQQEEKATVKKDGKASSLFQLIDREKFDWLVAKWEMDKGIRSFSTWEMTCSLVTALTMRLGSYREVEQALGVPRATLGDALTGRWHGFFEELCDEILLSIRGRTPNRKIKRAIRQILAIDSTEIKVHGSLFSEPGWAKKQGEGAAAKLHLVWNVDGEGVEDFLVTGGRRGDSPVSRRFEILPDKTYVFDRAYCDVDFWLKIIDAGSHFVTRLTAASIRNLKKRKDVEGKSADGVLYDGVYDPCLGALVKVPKERRLSVEFRYVVYRDPETKKVFYFVTSDYESPAQAIADAYKRRWPLELLCR